MAILSNLIVNGTSRLLGTCYANNIQISGSATFASLSTTGNMTVGGTLGVTGATTLSSAVTVNNNLTVSGTVTFTKTQDLSGTSNNGPALIVGGTANASHMEIDSNEVQAKGGTATTSSLYLNNDGGAVYLSSGGSIYANSGTFAAPTATISNATISGDLTVNGVLHSNEFIKNIVKAVGGQLYVSPTFQATGSTTISCTSADTSYLYLTLSDSGITSNQYAGAPWYANSKVMLSGTLTANTTGHTEEIIFSSAPGELTAQMNSTQNKLQIKIEYSNASTYFKAGTLTFSNIAVMMYQIKNNGLFYPVGIYIKAYGTDNQKSYIDIFGGSSTSPNARLGLLTGLGSMPSGSTIQGWGIYTDNGFFKGIIEANGGLIGNWTIGTTGMYYNSNAPSSTSITMIPGGTTASTTSIGGSSGSKQWIFTGKNLFGIDTDGKLYASSAEISGKITATSGAIGGFDITATAIKTKDVAVTSNADNSISLSSADFTRTINSVSRSGLRFAIGDKLGVTGDGAIYASSATISGAITATSGAVGGFKIDSTSIRTNDVAVTSNADNSISLSSSDFTRTIGGTSQAGLRFAIGDKFGITGDGVMYASSVILGQPSGYHATVNSSAFEVYSGAATSTKVASFGATALIGNMSSGVGFQISSTGNDAGMKFNHNGTQAFFVGVNTRYETTTANSSTYTITNSSTKITIEGQYYYYVCDVPSGVEIVGITGYAPEGYINQGDETESTVTDYSDAKYLKWTIQSNKFYAYTAMTDSGWYSWSQNVKYKYLVQSTTAIVEPYCVIGTSGYGNNVNPGINSLAQGNSCVATGNNAAALGNKAKATGSTSFASGWNTIASGQYSIAMGCNTIASGQYSAAIGYNATASGDYSTAMGAHTTVSGNYSAAFGLSTKSNGPYTFVSGYACGASGSGSVSMGYISKATGSYSVAMGREATASGAGSVALGSYSQASGTGSVALGSQNISSASNAVAMGYYAQVSKQYSGALGYHASVSGIGSIALGWYAEVSGSYSTALGYYAKASGSYSTAIGDSVQASAAHSTAIGRSTKAIGEHTIAMGYATVASSNYSTAIGKYNAATRSGSGTTASPYTYSNAGDYAFIIGNGTGDATADRSNALTVDWSGNTHIFGDLTVDGGITASNMIKVAKVFEGTQYVANTGSTAQTAVSFQWPSDFAESYGAILAQAWPISTWSNGAVVTICKDETLTASNPTPLVYLTSNTTQNYSVILYLLYKSSTP